MFKLLKTRLSFIAVVVVAGLATALVTGNGLVAAVTGIVVALAVSVAAAARSSKPLGDAQTQVKRASGDPIAFKYAWELEQSPDLGQVSQALAHHGLSLSPDTSSGSKMIFRGGSQLWTRLRGGYFVDPKRLPVVVELTVTSEESENGQHRLDLCVSDTLGVAVRDQGLEERYKQAADSIRETIENRGKLTPVDA